MPRPHPPFVVNVVNGATVLVPGSHKWHDQEVRQGESKERLHRHAQLSRCSLESFFRIPLDQAAQRAIPKSRFPHDLIALVEQGEDIEPFLAELDDKRCQR